MATPEQARAVAELIAAVGDAIESLGSVPSGELYIRLAQHGFIGINEYDLIINTLIRAGVVRRSNHMLTWVGKKES